MGVYNYYCFILTIYTGEVEYNIYNIGTIYDRSLECLVPEASLIWPLFHQFHAI